MTHGRRPYRILWYETLGFLAIVTISWLDELVGLPHLLFGGKVSGNWQESALETAVIATVGAVTIGMTRRLLNRVYYLEGFLRICAWCRRIDVDGHWLPIEDYVKTAFHAETSHGMCPDCMEKMVATTTADKTA